MMVKNLTRKGVLGASVLLVIFVLYSAYSIWSFSDENQLVPSDAAIVLGAAVWGNEPSPVFRERINHAIWLYQEGYVQKIIFTGGKGKDAPYAESEVAREFALKNKVKDKDILIEVQSTITEENLQIAGEIAAERNLKTFIVVSDPLHMKRAITIAKHMGMEVYSSPTPSSAYTSLQSKIPFFLRELFFYVGYLITLPFR